MTSQNYNLIRYFLGNPIARVAAIVNPVEGTEPKTKVEMVKEAAQDFVADVKKEVREEPLVQAVKEAADFEKAMDATERVIQKTKKIYVNRVKPVAMSVISAVDLKAQRAFDWAFSRRTRK